MATFLELTKGTEKLLTQTEALFRKFDCETAADNIREQLKAFQEKELTVVVAGEARRGKSSLLNALLNEQESVFPVDVNVCTNVVTVLRYGETEKIEAYIEDAASPQGCRIETITRAEIENYVSEKGNPNNFKKVKMLKAAVPNELLKEGIVFVDTPGVGSLNVEHAEATYGFLPNADLLLFVTDTMAGMTETELDFLRRGYSYCKNVIFALTKKDLAENYETFVEDNRQKISHALELDPEKIDIIPVSSVAKLRYLSTGRKAMYLNSNFQKLENCIWSTVARTRGEILLLPYLAGAREEVAKLLDNLVAQYQTLGSNATADLAEELNGVVKKLEELQDQGADWRNDLNLTFSLLQTRINAQQQAIAQDARDLIEERVQSLDKKLCQAANYKELISDVNDVITKGLLSIRDEIRQEVEGKMASLQDTLELQLDSNQDVLNRLHFQPEDPDIQFPQRKMSDQIITKGRNISLNGMGGGAVGGILGGIVGFCLGGPAGMELGKYLGAGLGTALGSAKGCMESLGKYDQVDLAAVTKAMNKHVATTMSGVASCISSVLTEVRVTVTTSFEKQLKKRVRELQENIAQLKRNISLAQSELPKRQAELKSQIDQLNKLLKVFDATMKQAVAREPAGEKPPKAEPRKQEQPAPREAPAEQGAVVYGFL